MNKDNLNKIIDTHAHLDFPDLYPRIQNVIADANLNDVCKIVKPGDIFFMHNEPYLLLYEDT